jgi:hypothetical protein
MSIEWNSSGVLNDPGFLELQAYNPYGIDIIINISKMTPEESYVCNNDQNRNTELREEFNDCKIR